MRAIVIRQHSGPEVLPMEEQSDPQPKPREVLIQVKASGINYAQISFRKGSG